MNEDKYSGWRTVVLDDMNYLNADHLNHLAVDPVKRRGRKQLQVAEAYNDLVDILRADRVEGKLVDMSEMFNVADISDFVARYGTANTLSEIAKSKRSKPSKALVGKLINR